jgi:alkanesulfonate monooxygenase SsuD/methylene tetrahydromethanopterin reductase-like flavin-dependent oxidoreductase (luciferase family)
MQAGGSERGWLFAAHRADVSVTINRSIEGRQAFRADVGLKVVE